MIYDSLFAKGDRPAKRRGPTLLVVEDSPSDFLLLQQRLTPLVKEKGIEFVHAESLAQAVRKVDAADAVILDLLLPNASDARTNEVFAELTQLPIILHTGSEDPQADTTSWPKPSAPRSSARTNRPKSSKPPCRACSNGSTETEGMNDQSCVN